MNSLHKKMIAEICEYFKCDSVDVFSTKRKQNLVYAKKVIYWILRKEGLSYNQIGRMLNKDHETIIVGIRSMPSEYNRYASNILRKYKKQGINEAEETAQRLLNEQMTKIVHLLNLGYSQKDIAEIIKESEKNVENKIIQYVELGKIPDYSTGKQKNYFFYKKNKKN